MKLHENAPLPPRDKSWLRPCLILSTKYVGSCDKKCNSATQKFSSTIKDLSLSGKLCLVKDAGRKALSTKPL